jgi:hypothetical protein
MSKDSIASRRASETRMGNNSPREDKDRARPATIPDKQDREVDSLRIVYEQLCQSYRAIDDFRSKLLGFLPFVTGAGVLALLGPLGVKDNTLLRPVGTFGFLVTLGLFCFEIHGIRKCHALINAGRRLECRWRIADGGQFYSRPQTLINEPFAAGVVYPTVGATWVYVAWNTPVLPLILAVTGFLATLWYARIWLPKAEPLFQCPEPLAHEKQMGADVPG